MADMLPDTPSARDLALLKAQIVSDEKELGQIMKDVLRMSRVEIDGVGDAAAAGDDADGEMAGEANGSVTGTGKGGRETRKKRTTPAALPPQELNLPAYPGVEFGDYAAKAFRKDGWKKAARGTTFSARVATKSGPRQVSGVA